jgi:polysaccharide biosynthesis transport protein
MSPNENLASDESPLGDYLRVIRRRKWIVVALVILAAGAAYAVSQLQQAEYEGQAQMILTQQDLLAGVSGQQSPPDAAQADRIVQTMADLARVPAVTARTLSAAGVHDLTPAELLATSSVTPSTNADVITFTVTHHDRDTAARLATAYAQQFGAYRHDLDTSSIANAQARIASELKKLNPAPGSATYNYLQQQSQQLQSLQVFQSPNAYVVHSASSATQVRPKPLRNAVLAGIVGLLLGVALAFLVETLDTRVHGVDEVRNRLGLRVLARIPTLRRRQDPLVMLDDPWSPQAEAFRSLRINLDLTDFRRHAKKIMIAGAQHDEGKSTTAANLAVALARAGRSVAVIDCDLHKPSLHTFFDINPAVGLTDVLLGDVPLERAIVSVNVSEGASLSSSVNGNGSNPTAAVVQVVPRGHARIEEKLVAGERIGRVLRALESRAEYMIVDTPPLLQFGDGAGVSAHVDAVVVVVGLKDCRRSALDELRRVLAVLPAEPLGVVVTGADHGPRGYYTASPQNDLARDIAAGRAAELDPSRR